MFRNFIAVLKEKRSATKYWIFLKFSTLRGLIYFKVKEKTESSQNFTLKNFAIFRIVIHVYSKISTDVAYSWVIKGIHIANSHYYELLVTEKMWKIKYIISKLEQTNFYI